MALLKTVKVRRTRFGDEAIINESDFNPSEHERLEDDGDEDLVRGMDTATTLESIKALQKEIETRRLSEERELSDEELDELRDTLEERARAIDDEKGPKYLPQPGEPGYPNPGPLVEGRKVPYEPYMAPPPAPSALRAHGVNPVAHAELGKSVQSEETRSIGQPAPDATDPPGRVNTSKVVDANVADARTALDKLKTSEELDEAEKAEKAGKARAGVLDYIAKRREQLSQG